MLRTMLFALSLCAVSMDAYSGGQPSKICLLNKSIRTQYVTGQVIRDDDWRDRYDDGAMNRPDFNWQNTPVGPGEVICRLADINGAGNGRARHFFFNITPIPGTLTPSRNQMRSVHWDSGKFNWAINLEGPAGNYKRNLSGGTHVKDSWKNYINPLRCLDPRDPDFKVCDMFVITH